VDVAPLDPPPHPPAASAQPKAAIWNRRNNLIIIERLYFHLSLRAPLTRRA
jgi:hypothetical protein